MARDLAAEGALEVVAARDPAVVAEGPAAGAAVVENSAPMCSVSRHSARLAEHIVGKSDEFVGGELTTCRHMNLPFRARQLLTIILV